MIQTVKTIIRWRDEDGCVLGAIRESEINLPKQGKRHFLRNEVCLFITTLIYENHSVTKQPKRFKDFALSAFNPDRIIQIKARTKGSFLNLKDDELKQFIINNNIH